MEQMASGRQRPIMVLSVKLGSWFRITSEVWKEEWLYALKLDLNKSLRVLFIGLVLIPGLNVTLNFPASPVMARDLKLDFVSPPPSHTVASCTCRGGSAVLALYVKDLGPQRY
jgi:hypothetical protein